MGQGCRFDLRSEQIQESTNSWINETTNKPFSLSPAACPPPSKINKNKIKWKSPEAEKNGTAFK